MATKSSMPKTVPNAATGENGAKNAFKNNVASAGNLRTADYPAVKTTGIKMRGTGAATKGLMSRGPMA